jgi:Rrf2 family protein
LNITSKGRYALRVMLDLAQHAGDGFISLKTVADRQDISLKYLESIVSSLKKGGLLESTRGKGGGYRITGEPEECSVGEVLRCTEDKLSSVSCIRDGSVCCDRAGECMAVPMWMELDEISNAYLDTVSLKDLLTGDKWNKKKKGNN